MQVARRAEDALQYVVDETLRAMSATAAAAGTAPAAEAVEVTGNHGRWIVECPDCRDGAGTQLACESDRRFMCHECLNVAVGGLWRPTVWPSRLREISDLLDARDVEHRNYEPGETLADLVADDAAHAAWLALGEALAEAHRDGYADGVADTEGRD